VLQGRNYLYKPVFIIFTNHLNLNTVDLLIGYLVFAIILMAIAIAIMRAVFSIPTIVDNLKEQTSLLKDIAVTQRAVLKNQEDAKKS
jgi:hypothetical protein